MATTKKTDKTKENKSITIPDLYKFYKTEVIQNLKKDFGYKNVMQVPKIKKVVINVGVGKFLKDANHIKSVEKVLTKISGQKPVRTKAKQSISNFKIREDMDIGVMVTLRGVKMYQFLEKLLNVTLPRIRDFRGISNKSFDKNGNYSLGFRENVSFPELKSGESDKNHGMQVVLATNAKNIEEGKALLTYLGFPFVK